MSSRTRIHPKGCTWFIWLTSLAFTLAGCRFGNYVQPAPAPVTVTYYETSPQAVTFCASPSIDASQVCQPGTIEQIPRLISSVMTDPVALRVDHVKDQAHLVGLSTNNPRLPTILNPDQTLEFDGATPFDPLWLDPGCTTHLRVTEREGQVISSPQPGTVTVSGTTFPVNGRIQLTIDVIRSFKGDCSASLKAMHDCYVDPNQCQGATARENLDLQSVVQAYFEDFIEAGVLTVSEIQTVTGVSYSVSYR